MKRSLRLLRSVLPSSRRQWVDVGGVDEFPVESVRCVQVRGTKVAVFHTEDGLAAIADVCPHLGGSLSEGVLHGDGFVQCAEYDVRFSLRDGACPGNPMYNGRVYPARAWRGRVQLQA
ncbi:MAG: nitrite reductase (NAD(P)H) small subunit [Candidatus Poribacteria bacterium]